MNTEENNQAVVADTTNGEGESETTNEETVSISKTEYDKLNQTLGSLKRELKDYKKSKEETPETSKKNDKSDEFAKILERVEKTALRQANISHEDDIDLAKSTAKKWGMDLEDVLLDPDFKLKLERQQTERDNLNATSKIRGGGGQSQAKLTPEYWISKGTPPSPADVPDRKTRSKILRAMMSDNNPTKKFYND